MLEEDDLEEIQETDEVEETEADEEEAVEADSDDTEEEGAEPEEEEDDSDEESGEEEKPKPKRKRGKSAERRIKQLTAQKRALQEQLEARRPKSEPLTAPNKDDFEDYEDYIAAQAEYKALARIEKREKDNADYENERKRISRITEFHDSLDDVRDKYDDFDEVAFDDSNPITETMGEAIMTSEAGGELAYYLGKHPKEAAQIAALQSPVAQATALGRLEAKIMAPKPKKISGAPQPISTRKAPPKASVDDMSVDELMEYMGQPHN